MKALPVICFCALAAAASADNRNPQGCIEMQGVTRCVQGSPSQHPTLERDTTRANALSRNCQEWRTRYIKDRTEQNKVYMIAACDRSRAHSQTMMQRMPDYMREGMSEGQRRLLRTR